LEAFFAEAFGRICDVAEGRTPSGPKFGRKPYPNLDYHIEPTGKRIKFGQLERTGSCKQLVFEAVTGYLYCARQCLDGAMPTITGDVLQAEDAFAIVSQIDTADASAISVSCSIETKDVHGKKPWKLAGVELFLLVVDRDGTLIGIRDVAVITGTRRVNACLTLPLRAEIGGVKVWIRKFVGTTGNCRLKNLEVRLL